MLGRMGYIDIHIFTDDTINQSWMSTAKRWWRQWHLWYERSPNLWADLSTLQAGYAEVGSALLSILTWRLPSSWFNCCSLKNLTPDTVHCIQTVGWQWEPSQWQGCYKHVSLLQRVRKPPRVNKRGQWKIIHFRPMLLARYRVSSLDATRPI